jgi:hypothetical protein
MYFPFKKKNFYKKIFNKMELMAAVHGLAILIS